MAFPIKSHPRKRTMKQTTGGGLYIALNNCQFTNARLASLRTKESANISPNHRTTHSLRHLKLLPLYSPPKKILLLRILEIIKIPCSRIVNEDFKSDLNRS